MDYTQFRIGMDILQFLLTAGIGLYAWIATRHRATAESLRELERAFEQRLDKHDSRIATMEERIEHLPSHEDIGKVWGSLESLHADMAAVQTEVRGIRDVIAPLARSVERINDYLLKSK